MNFEAVEKIAAAILYEGYILYPYRKTAIKNQQRWNFGTLYPCIYAEGQRPTEPCRLQAEILVIDEPEATLDVKISFLQLVRQDDVAATPELTGLTDSSLAWEEAVERTSEHLGLKVSDLLSTPLQLTLQIEASMLPPDRSPAPSAKLQAHLVIRAERLNDGSCRIHIELENTSPLAGGAGSFRREALSSAFVSAHLVLGITGGDFISLLDPPEAYSNSAAACANIGVFPVLAGEEPARSLMLCSPIILYDYPKVAPESEGDFFDGTEMDEMLTLRVLTLTDSEKEEIRQGDPRARRILERTELLTSETILKAHGTVRSLRQVHEDQL